MPFSSLMPRAVHFVFAAMLAVVLARCVVLFATPNYNVAAEANNLYGILDFSEGKPLYPLRTQRPYSVYLYTPLHAYLTGGLVKALGLGTLRSKVLVIRAFSFFSLVAAYLLLWFGVWKRCGAELNLHAFWIAAGLGASKFADYATAARNDTLALLIEVALLAVLLKWNRSPKIKWLVLFTGLSVASVWTRQTGLVVFSAGMLWWIYRREWKIVFGVGAAFLIINALFFSWLYVSTSGQILDHIILSNIRGFRPLNFQFFDLSLLSFLLSYVAFVGLMAVGMKSFAPYQKNPERQLIALVFVLSFALAALVFMRAGGDVNYFFETLFVGTGFVAAGLERLRQSSARNFLAAGLAAQMLLVSAVYVGKTHSAWVTGQTDFEEGAAMVKERFAPLGFIMGLYGQSLGIYLRGWAMHGPDVTNAGFVAKNGHRDLRWILADLETQVKLGKVTAVIMAGPNCKDIPFFGDWARRFSQREVLKPWLCAYHAAPISPSSGRVGVLLEESNQTVADQH